jgi:hypothetical protein
MEIPLVYLCGYELVFQDFAAFVYSIPAARELWPVDIESDVTLEFSRSAFLQWTLKLPRKIKHRVPRAKGK